MKNAVRKCTDVERLERGTRCVEKLSDGEVEVSPAWMEGAQVCLSESSTKVLEPGFGEALPGI